MGGISFSLSLLLSSYRGSLYVEVSSSFWIAEFDIVDEVVLLPGWTLLRRIRAQGTFHGILLKHLALFLSRSEPRSEQAKKPGNQVLIFYVTLFI